MTGELLRLGLRFGLIVILVSSWSTPRPRPLTVDEILSPWRGPGAREGK